MLIFKVDTHGLHTMFLLLMLCHQESKRLLLSLLQLLLVAYRLADAPGDIE